MTLHASSLSYFQQVSETAKVCLSTSVKLSPWYVNDHIQVLEARDGAEGLTTESVNEKLLIN